MSLKILGGEFKGLSLKTLDMELLRPTQVLLKRRIFDSHQNFHGQAFIDVFSGTGSIGIEVLSRGGEHVYFFEKHPKIFKLLKENLLELNKKYNCQNFTVKEGDGLQSLMSYFHNANFRDQMQNESTIIFIDPPYEQHQSYFTLLEFLKNEKFPGEIWIESDMMKGPKKELLLQCVNVQKEFVQGGSYFLKSKL